MFLEILHQLIFYLFFNKKKLIYKNNILKFHVGYKPQALTIDQDNNIWVIYNTNHVLKLDSNLNLVWSKQINYMGLLQLLMLLHLA